LGSDIPLDDPADDSFGYAQFASLLAEAIVANKNPRGLVLAVHGKWGSGKSSLLNFIKHDLKLLTPDQRPVVIDFNPWWFEGREQIATQLLAQFSAQLPDNLKHARALAKLVGKYSKQIASAAATYTGYGWLSAPLASVLGKIPLLSFFSEKTGVPQIKKKVADALIDSGKRFVFFVDDIDRLTPDEARDFFRAIKALADFPEVVYVLFFDREQVATALSASLKMDGAAYLEKIVQAPFHIPAVDKGLLQQKLFKGLDAIIESRPLPFDFDQQRWGAIFQDGLSHSIGKPRDLVRILNALAVTYPPLAGEVNPVDFMALEFLRVFEPEVYGSIRDGKEFFCGEVSELSYKKDFEREYLERWRDSLPTRGRAALMAIVGRVFPKVSKILGGNFVVSLDAGVWRRELRPCSVDCFDVYFQFGLPQGHIARAELEVLTNQETPDQMVGLLLDAKAIVFPDGHSKARDLIERLRDLNTLEPEKAAKLIDALISSGDQLLGPADERGGFFSLPNRWRIEGIATKLMERLPIVDRQALIKRLVAESKGLWCVVGLVDLIIAAKEDPSKAPDAILELDDALGSELSAVVGARLDAAPLEALLQMPELDFIVHRWHRWGNPDRVREKFAPMMADDGRLELLIDKFVRTGLRHSGEGTNETYRLSMTPLGLVMDIVAMEPRLVALKARSGLSRRLRESLAYYMKALPILLEGKNPDDMMFVGMDD